MKILMLHGSHQCGTIFEERLVVVSKRLRKDFDAELHFVDGSVELALGEGQSIPMRAWWRRETGDGWAQSLDTIRAAAQRCGGFDGVIGTARLRFHLLMFSF